MTFGNPTRNAASLLEAFFFSAHEEVRRQQTWMKCWSLEIELRLTAKTGWWDAKVTNLHSWVLIVPKLLQFSVPLLVFQFFAFPGDCETLNSIAQQFTIFLSAQREHVMWKIERCICNWSRAINPVTPNGSSRNNGKLNYSMRIAWIKSRSLFLYASFARTAPADSIWVTREALNKFHNTNCGLSH